MKVYADGADIDQMLRADVDGFTTNPTLARQAGVTDYLLWAKNVTAQIARPVSFEVTADDEAGMERQAHTLAGLGPNVYVKIPVTNTRGVSLVPLMARLAAQGVQVNATAITTYRQAYGAFEALSGAPGVVSVFAGRIADTGVDPVPVVRALKRRVPPNVELLWASAREVLNIVQAEASGCDIITLTPALLAKRSWLGRDLERVSLDTVCMFRDDAVVAGFDW